MKIIVAIEQDMEKGNFVAPDNAMNLINSIQEEVKNNSGIYEVDVETLMDTFGDEFVSFQYRGMEYCGNCSNVCKIKEDDPGNWCKNWKS